PVLVVSALGRTATGSGALARCPCARCALLSAAASAVLTRGVDAGGKRTVPGAVNAWIRAVGSAERGPLAARHRSSTKALKWSWFPGRSRRTITTRDHDRHAEHRDDRRRGRRRLRTTLPGDLGRADARAPQRARARRHRVHPADAAASPRPR